MKTFFQSKLKGLIAIVVLLVTCGWGIGNAAATTIWMSDFYAGETPPAATNINGWASADLSYSNGVESLTLNTYLAPGVFVGGVNKTIGWAFSISGLPSISSEINCLSGACGTSISYTDINTGPVAGSGKTNPVFNLGIYWANQALMGNATVTYSWNASSAASFFATDTGNYNDLLSAVHIQGYSGCSGFIINGNAGPDSPGTITSCGTSTVPEPSELPLVALGLTLMFLGGLWSKRRSSRVKIKRD